MPRFSLLELESEVRRLAAEHPSATYKVAEDEYPDETNRVCFYTIGSAGSGCGCLIGQALMNLAPESRAAIEAFDRDPGVDGGLVHVLRFFYGLEAPLDIRWLRDVQHLQDSRFSWSEAVSRADLWWKGRKALIPNSSIN